MKIIKVKNCKECPYRREDNGGGFIEPFDICDKFGIILIDEHKWSDLNEIHKDCKLENAS
jgi:hypothetical protein